MVNCPPSRFPKCGNRKPALLHFSGPQEGSRRGQAGQPDAVQGGGVEEAGSAIVVMGAYGHSRIRSFVIRCITSGMLRSCKAQVPLMR